MTTLPPASQLSDVLMEPPTDIMDDPLTKPVTSQTENKPVSEVVSESSDDFVDLTNNITEAAADTAAAEDTTEISLDEPPDYFVDILGSETRAPQEEAVVTDVSVAAATDKSEVYSNTTDPPGVGKQEEKETSTAPIISLIGDSSASKTQRPPDIDKYTDPLVDLLTDAPPAAEAKKPSRAAFDLFEDEGSDLFADPMQIKSAKQPQKSLFGEPDEDLFGEPLGATTKKTISKGQKDISVTSKAAAVNVAGPLEVRNPAEPADIFTEESTSTVPGIGNSNAVNSKTNEVHSEEEADIFAGGLIMFTLWLHYQDFVSNLFVVVFCYFVDFLPACCSLWQFSVDAR